MVELVQEIAELGVDGLLRNGNFFAAPRIDIPHPNR
jgi:hypothetical protein